MKQAILEAQELAVTRHNVEFKSNLWIGELNNQIQSNNSNVIRRFFQPNRSVEKEKSLKALDVMLELAVVGLNTSTFTTSLSLKRAPHQITTTCLTL